MHEKLTSPSILKPPEANPTPKWEVEEVLLDDYREQIKTLIESCKLSTGYLEHGEVWLVVKDRDQVIGCITIETRDNLVHIQSLSVQKNMRRKGVARALVEAIYTHHTQPGQILIAMTLFWNNATYKALGFQHLSPELKQNDDVGRRDKHKFCTVWGKPKK